MVVAFSACADPYNNYVSSGLEPKTQIMHELEDDYKWYYDTELKLLTSYADYEKFDVDLGYTEGYFELNCLLVFLRTGNSSANLKFIDVRENDGKLYPVLECNYFGPEDPQTDDVIYYAFYAEIPLSANYSIGDVINQTRTENVY